MFLRKFIPFQNACLPARYSSNYNRIMNNKIKNMERRLTDIEVYLTALGKLLQSLDPRCSEEELQRQLDTIRKTRKYNDRVQMRGCQVLVNEDRDVKRFGRGARSRPLKTPEESQSPEPEGDEVLLMLRYNKDKMGQAVFCRPSSGLGHEILDFSNYNNWRDHPGLTKKRIALLAQLDFSSPEGKKNMMKAIIRNCTFHYSGEEDP